MKKLTRRKERRRKTTKFLNYVAMVSIVSMFNALFYYGAFSLSYAIPIFVFLFIFTVTVYAYYKLVNRKIKRDIFGKEQLRKFFVMLGEFGSKKNAKTWIKEFKDVYKKGDFEVIKIVEE